MVHMFAMGIEPIPPGYQPGALHRAKHVANSRPIYLSVQGTLAKPFPYA